MNKSSIRYLLIAILACVFLYIGNISVSAKSNDYSLQVKQGVSYFSGRAEEQLPLVENLLSALKSGNIQKAQKAYVDSRPPYEEIEVYAGSFEQEDSDIDARPYAFDDGEQSSDFKGFHRIEAFIYRDGNLNAAIPYAEELIGSVKSLQAKLSDLSNFSPSQNFDGMIAVATEVPAKKISSEEETWSDQSLLIFKHNWIGIQSQFEPYKSLLGSSLVNKVDSAYQNCMNTLEPYFRPGEVGAKPYSSLSPTQRGAIVKAAYRYRDAIIEAKEALNIPDQV